MMAQQQTAKFSALIAPQFLRIERTGAVPKWHCPSPRILNQRQPYTEASPVTRSSIDCQEIVTVRAPSA